MITSLPSTYGDSAWVEYMCRRGDRLERVGDAVVADDLHLAGEIAALECRDYAERHLVVRGIDAVDVGCA